MIFPQAVPSWRYPIASGTLSISEGAQAGRNDDAAQLVMSPAYRSMTCLLLLTFSYSFLSAVTNGHLSLLLSSR